MHASIAVPTIAVEPDSWRRDALLDAVSQGGGEIADPADAEGLIWIDPDNPSLLRQTLDASSRNRWVQLPFAGIEPFIPVLDKERLWTCGKGVYAEPVAEHAMGLLLAGFRGLNTYIPASTWEQPQGRNLLDSRVTILGGGAITQELLRLLSPWGCDITVLRNRPSMAGGAGGGAGQGGATQRGSGQRSASKIKTVGSDQLHQSLQNADAVILALALTDQTRGIIAAPELEQMPSHSWLVNVARGEHVVTDDLVAALGDGTIAGAALDVTDPEPLPDDHPLWGMANCIITPHVGNTPEMGLKLLAERTRENVSRFASGEELLGEVFVDLGY